MAVNGLRRRWAAPSVKRGLLPSPPAGGLASRIDAPDRDMSRMSLQFVGTLGQNSIGRRPARIGLTPAGRATSAIAHRVLPAVDRSARCQTGLNVLVSWRLPRLLQRSVHRRVVKVCVTTVCARWLSYHISINALISNPQRTR